MRILVAQGGLGPEREVSLRSGASVAEALRAAGHEAILEDLVSVPEFVRRWPDRGAAGVFVALHGDFGEDGRLQACLDLFGIPYTGSGPRACMLAMDKEASKAMFRSRGIPTPPGETLRRGEAEERVAALRAEHGILVIKPASCGSTVGVTILREGGAGEALDLAFSYDERVVAEAYVPGAELTAAVFDEGGETICLPLVEIRPHGGMYDYGSKYTKGRTDYLCPAPLPEAVGRAVQDLAVRAHRVLGCSVYSRVDFRLSPEGEPFVLEVNTAPGMTDTSLVPKAAAAAGWSFPELVDRICRASFAGWRGRARGGPLPSAERR